MAHGEGLHNTGWNVLWTVLGFAGTIGLGTLAVNNFNEARISDGWSVDFPDNMKAFQPAAQFMQNAGYIAYEQPGALSALFGGPADNDNYNKLETDLVQGEACLLLAGVCMTLGGYNVVALRK